MLIASGWRICSAEGADRVDEQAMLDGVDACFERLECVVGEDRHVFGGEHGAVVDAGIGHEVHHHTGAGALAGQRFLPGAFDGMHAR